MQPENTPFRPTPGFLERFFGLSMGIFCVADLSGRFVRVNETCVKTLGWDGDELVTLPLLDFMHPDDVAATLTEFLKLGNGENTLRLVNRYRHKDQSYRHLERSARAAYPGDNLIYASARDITDRREAEASLESNKTLYAAILDTLPARIALIDPLGIIISRARTRCRRKSPDWNRGRVNWIIRDCGRKFPPLRKRCMRPFPDWTPQRPAVPGFDTRGDNPIAQCYP